MVSDRQKVFELFRWFRITVLCMLALIYVETFTTTSVAQPPPPREDCCRPNQSPPYDIDCINRACKDSPPLPYVDPTCHGECVKRCGGSPVCVAGCATSCLTIVPPPTSSLVCKNMMMIACSLGSSDGPSASKQY